jgi:N-acetylmuramoyl-L-alanine amidase
MITDLSWTQTRPGVYEINLRLAEALWGYDARYENGRLIVEFRRPPVVKRDLAGLRIVVDAGHCADPGAVGPTGMLEKDANLRIAWKLKRYLERKGAFVIMTRRGEEHVALYDRPAKAVTENADLFISIHNNSVPDGVNPYIRNGTGTYYYHPSSRDFARAVQRATLAASKLDDYGVTHGNFAVIRPTQYPSILVECAFIILPDQEEMLGTDQFVTRLGRGIARGVQQFVRERLGN